MKILKSKKIEYRKFNALKGSMSQYFADDSKLVPFTELKIVAKDDFDVAKSAKEGAKIKISGISKGKGFAGVMKRWGFSGGPATHGQKNTQRSPGSIGTQGAGRVIPGKKMPGRDGSKKVTMFTNLVSVDKGQGLIKVKGAIPGARNSKVVVYFANDFGFDQSEEIAKQHSEDLKTSVVDLPDNQKPQSEDRGSVFSRENTRLDPSAKADGVTLENKDES